MKKSLQTLLALFLAFSCVGQSLHDTLKMFTNTSFKYWDCLNGVSWRLSGNGELAEYHFDKFNNREQPDLLDIIISNHSWAISHDTLYEMALPRVLGQYKIVTLSKDTLVLMPMFGWVARDTLRFISSKDQTKPIIKLVTE